jgi:hypothetical protein
MTDKTKLVAISRTDDMSALDALKLLRFRRYNTARSQLRVTSVWSAWCARHGLTPSRSQRLMSSAILMG